MSETLEFEVFTIFPAAISAFVEAGIMGKAIARELVAVHCTDLRAFAHDRHRTVDDSPFGGGAGMVIKPEPVAEALDAVLAERGPMHTILLTPSGARFDQRVAERLATHRRIALLCGRYEGIDDRIREHYVDECLSIGDFVLNGGEVAAAVIIEAVARLREGVLGNPDSIARESFAVEHDDGSHDAGSHDAALDSAWQPGLVLEHPHYTRPAVFRGHEVPAVLLAGDHDAVERWRRRTACLRTWMLRPELRPHWELPASHPIYLVISASLAEHAEHVAALHELAARAGLQLASVGPRPIPGHDILHMRDLKQLAKAVRKRHERSPWLIGVGERAGSAPRRGPRLVLDVLAYESLEPPAPLLLWLGGPSDPALDKCAPRAWLALDPDPARDRTEPHNSSPRLALASALIDIAQPQAAPPSVVPLARAVVHALHDDGLRDQAQPSESSP